jgi:hypothetical protein
MPEREGELLFITMTKKKSQRQTFNDDQKRYQRQQFEYFCNKTK